MSRARIGDIIEFTLSSGKFAYAQYTHDHQRDKPKYSYGQLIRVLPGTFDTPPDDLNAIARTLETFYTFFDIDYCVERGFVRIAGHAAVPEWAIAFPRFRENRNLSLRADAVPIWVVWDGETTAPVNELTPELARLSVLGKATPGYITSLIERGYRAEDDI